MQVALAIRVLPRSLFADHAVGCANRDAKIDDQILSRQSINVIFKLLQPPQEPSTLLSAHAGSLMRQVRANVAVGKKNFAGRKLCFHLRLRFEAVAGIEKGRKMRIDVDELAKVAVQELRDQFAEEPIVPRKAEARVRDSVGLKRASEQFDLRALSGTIDSFENDQFSVRSHGEPVSLARVFAC